MDLLLWKYFKAKSWYQLKIQIQELFDFSAIFN